MRLIFFTAVVTLLLLTASAHAQTQTDEHRFEVGAFYTAINLDGFGETVSGLGGRLGYNFNQHVALDAEGSFFPETHLGNSQTGQKTQGFVGVKAGARSKYVGVFAKARPGVMFIGEVTSGFNCSSSGLGQVCRPQHNNFALDVGGVVEFYPSSRTIIRVDAGDTIVRLHSATLGIFSPAQSSTDITHNFQASIGFGYRF
jgi:opacity protein-like surface antigen